jgi:GDP-mannose 4,6 dehydratase
MALDLVSLDPLKKGSLQFARIANSANATARRDDAGEECCGKPSKERIVMKKACVTGITGQDGAYLAKLLLEKGYEVYGIIRRSSTADVNDTRLKWLGIVNDVKLLDGNMTDISSLIRILREIRPDQTPGSL